MLLDAPGLVTYFGRAVRFWIRFGLFQRAPLFHPAFLTLLHIFFKI